MKLYTQEEVSAFVKEAIARRAREKAAAELPERTRKTEAALAVLKNADSTEGGAFASDRYSKGN